MENPTDPFQELDEAEAAARMAQAPVLETFHRAYTLSDRALRLYGAAMEHRAESAPHDLPSRAHRFLLPRLADDLRAAWLLASSGYWLQATTLASAALEVAATIGFIGLSQQRAEKWLHWSKLDKTPWPVASLIDGALARWKGQPDSDGARAWKTWYRVFCWAKHANPTLQTRVLGSLTPADHVIGVTPEVVPGANWRLWITLYSLLQLTTLAAAGLLADETVAPADVVEVVRELLAAMRSIAAGEEGVSSAWVGA